MAVNGLDLAIRRGELLSLLGPNGAGKSTTLRILTTLMTATSGRVLIAGHEVPRDNDLIRPLVGLVPQEIALYETMTVRANLRFFGAPYGLRRAELDRQVNALLQAIALADRANDPIMALSGGMQRRVNIAAALVHDPAIVFLDEPTVGLDPGVRGRSGHSSGDLKVRGKTLVLTTHYMEEAEILSDRVAIVDRGKAVAVGTAAELVQATGIQTCLNLTLASDGKGCVERLTAPAGEKRRLGRRPGPRLHGNGHPDVAPGHPDLAERRHRSPLGRGHLAGSGRRVPPLHRAPVAKGRLMSERLNLMTKLRLAGLLAWKDCRIRFQHPVMFVFVVLLPLAMVLLTGLAFQGFEPGARVLTVAIEDNDGGAAGKQVRDLLESAARDSGGHLRLASEASGRRELTGVIVLPKGLTKRLNAGDECRIELKVGAEARLGSPERTQLDAVVDRLVNRLRERQPRPLTWEVVADDTEKPLVEGFDSFSQAVTGNGVMFILLNSVLIGGMSLVRERRTHTLDRLLLSPMSAG